MKSMWQERRGLGEGVSEKEDEQLEKGRKGGEKKGRGRDEKNNAWVSLKEPITFYASLKH